MSLHYLNVSMLVAVNYLWPLVFLVTALPLLQTDILQLPSLSITQRGYVQSFSSVEIFGELN